MFLIDTILDLRFMLRKRAQVKVCMRKIVHMNENRERENVIYIYTNAKEVTFIIPLYCENRQPTLITARASNKC